MIRPTYKLERTGKTKDNHFLSLGVFGHIDLLGWEPVVELHRGSFVSSFDDHGEISYLLVVPG